MAGYFDGSAQAAIQEDEQQGQAGDGGLIDYSICPMSKFSLFFAYMVSYIAITIVCYLFYKSLIVGAFCAVIISPFIIKSVKQNAVKKRMLNLRLQFRDMLESMSISMRAGNNEIKALESAYNDLILTYSENTDMVIEVRNMLALYNSGIPLRDLFRSFAQRCGLEDVNSFANIFEAIEGKSDRSYEIMRQTQSVIADKIEIEAEIETMITSTKSEQNIMFVMPIIMVAMMNFMGEGFMDAIHTTFLGRIVATVTIVIFVSAFLISNKILDFKV